jgi:hypothetical protein
LALFGRRVPLRCTKAVGVLLLWFMKEAAWLTDGGVVICCGMHLRGVVGEGCVVWR